MIFGLCTNGDIAGAAKAAGFTFIDSTVGEAIRPDATEDEFYDHYEENFAGAKLPLTNLAVLLPGTIKLCGPDATRLSQSVAYIEKVFRRAKYLEIRHIAFGSGGARKCPEGWDKTKAVAQITEFVKAIAPVVKESGVMLGVENLRFAETNTLNLLGEVAQVVAESGAGDEIGFLVDGFHWKENKDDASALPVLAGRIKHTHIATSPSRRAPGEEATDFAPFAALLKAAGYDDMMAVEATFNDKTPAGLARMFKTLDSAFN